MKSQRVLILTMGLLLSVAPLGCASPEPAPEPAPPSPAPVPAQASKSSPRVRILLVEYRDTLVAAEREGEASYKTGVIDSQALGELRLARLGAELDVAETREERLEILTALFGVAQGQETLLKGQYDAGASSRLELLQVRALRIQAEIAMEEEKARKR